MICQMQTVFILSWVIDSKYVNIFLLPLVFFFCRNAKVTAVTLHLIMSYYNVLLICLIIFIMAYYCVLLLYIERIMRIDLVSVGHPKLLLTKIFIKNSSRIYHIFFFFFFSE